MRHHLIHCGALRRLSAAGLCALVALWFPLAGCGKKAPPFMPLRSEGKVLEYFRATPYRGGILVSWMETAELPAAPQGKRWAEYHLSRTDSRADFQEVKTMKVTGGGSARYQYVDLSVERGSTYRYLLKLITDDRRAGYTHPEIRLTAGEGPPPPGPPRVAEGDGQVTLAWDLSGGLPPGQTAAGFNVFRREGGKKLDRARALNPAPVTEPRYLDTPLENERGYCWAVSRIFTDGAATGESDLSAETCAAAHDRTPPAPPSGLTALMALEEIVLSWEENKETDLAGYRVYRRTGPEGIFSLRSSGLVKTPVFRDRVDPGLTNLYYVVTAVDSSPAANESPYSQILEVVLAR